MFNCICILRYLATGASFADLALRFRVGHSTTAKIIKETLKAIVQVMLPIALPKKREKDWEKISDEFLRRWNFPNCLGAIDGKHCAIFAPRNSGSLHYSYKKAFSTVLMASVDARYRFIMIDVGAYGANHDANVFANSAFGKQWLNQDQRLCVPKNTPLPSQTVPTPYVVVADEAFGLKTNILTPYPGNNLSRKQRVFNYRYVKCYYS